jgi:hypothetical protein
MRRTPTLGNKLPPSYKARFYPTRNPEEPELHGGTRSCLVVSELDDQIIYPYLMHFARTGRFGRDTNATTSGCGYHCDYFGEEKPLGGMPIWTERATMTWSLAAKSAYFFYSYPQLRSETSVTVIPGTQKTYGSKSLRIKFNRGAGPVRYYVCIDEKLREVFPFSSSKGNI